MHIPTPRQDSNVHLLKSKLTLYSIFIPKKSMSYPLLIVINTHFQHQFNIHNKAVKTQGIKQESRIVQVNQKTGLLNVCHQFHTKESVRLSLYSKSNEKSSPEIKMSMSEQRMLKMYFSFSLLRQQNKIICSLLHLPF